MRYFNTHIHKYMCLRVGFYTNTFVCTDVAVLSVYWIPICVFCKDVYPMCSFVCVLYLAQKSRKKAN